MVQYNYIHLQNSSSTSAAKYAIITWGVSRLMAYIEEPCDHDLVNIGTRALNSFIFERYPLIKEGMLCLLFDVAKS